MDAGSDMLYPASVVDGIVHRLGGKSLRLECDEIGYCPTGMSVSTTRGEGALVQCFDRIIHTAPPFYSYDQPSSRMLRSCYRSSLELAFSTGEIKVACPLIGAGARGFPLEIAIEVAASESIRWRDGPLNDNNFNTENQVLLFGIPDPEVGERLADLQCSL